MPYSDPEKRREFHRNFIQQRKEKWFLENGPCWKCGTTENLQVDHTDPSIKSFSIHWGVREDVLAIELAKCKPLCEACHKEKSSTEKTKTTPLQNIPDYAHGTTSGYIYWKCRCSACRGLIAAKMRARRKNPSYRKKELVRQRAKWPSPKVDYHLGNACPPPKEKPEVHGSQLAYYRNGCRCGICVTWHSDFCSNRTEEHRQFRIGNPVQKRQKQPTAHGTTMEYNRGCRCDQCRAASSAQTKAKYVPRPPRVKKGITHGLYASYCTGACRCNLCKAAAQKYRDEKKARKGLPSAP